MVEGPLAHIPLFSRLARAEQEELLASMPKVEFAAQEPIFWHGDKGDSFYLVDQGQVSITVPNTAGEHVVLNVLSSGGFFGEISLLDGGPRTASVRALEPTTLYQLGREQFHAFLRRKPEVAIEILGVMGQRQRDINEAVRGMSNANIAFEQTRITHWQKFSDVITNVSASQGFTMFHACWFSGWIIFNLMAGAQWLPIKPFDPYPFGLLTMVVSLEAIFLAIIVMVSQSRQSEKDRIKADLDYHVNVKAQTEIMSIAQRLERIEGQLIHIDEEIDSPSGERRVQKRPPMVL
jgi:CRP/FNR family cyclic AMP-dependent transcriptional regulator